MFKIHEHQEVERILVLGARDLRYNIARGSGLVMGYIYFDVMLSFVTFLTCIFFCLNICRRMTFIVNIRSRGN